MNRLVLFGQNPKVEDCAHVCYGSDAAYQEFAWDEKRAERIAWIALALKSPNEIRPDKDGPGREKYLLRIASDSQSGQDEEYYCVVVEVRSKKCVGFITAYYINSVQFDKYGREAPRIYPRPVRPVPKKKRGTKKIKPGS
jgi:hypothetical protein